MPTRPDLRCSLCQKDNEPDCHHCPVCRAEDCYKHCYTSPNGKHEADPRSAVQASGADFTVDMTCKFCGRSGGVAVDPKDIDWG